MRRPRLVVQSLEDRTTPAQIIVTSLADDGTTGTLRVAIDQANSTGVADEIVFEPTLFPSAQTITLTQGELGVSSSGGNLTITGPGANLLTVDGAGASRVLSSSSPVLTLRRFSVANGRATNINGGGLFASNSVVVDRMVFTNNVATGTGFGAGSGGAIGLASNSALTVRNSTISGNTAAQNGGGIYFYFDGDLLIVNSSITGNSTTEATNSKGGAAIYGYGYAYGWEIINTTIANNTTASSGGAINLRTSSGLVSIINSTIVGNSAANANANQGGGGLAVVSGSASFDIVNSVISGNTAVAPANGPDILSANSVTVNYSALGDPNNGFTLSGGNGNLTGNPAALGLGGLTNNGGPHQTMAPAPGTSILIDAGDNNAVPAGLTTDGRGLGFVRNFGGTVDIGAVEDQPPGLPYASGEAADVAAPTATPYEFTVTYEDPNGTNNGIQAADVFNNNAVVRVTGPNGFDQLATYVSPATLNNGPLLTVTYQITPPGGGWAATANGSYTISIEPNQVRDLDNNFVPGGSVAGFSVLIPQTLVVTTNADDGPGSLRAAIVQAEAVPSDDLIVFDPTVFNTATTISLLSQLPVATPVGGGLTIDGPGPEILTVTRDAGAATDFRIMNTYGAALTLTDFTITGGTAAAGAVAAFGPLAMDNMVLTANAATGIAGAVFVGSGQTATIANSVISGNTAAGVGGGIIVSSYANLTLDNSTVADNSGDGPGGGIFVDFNGNLSVIDTTISGNTATTNGGGIYFFANGSLRVENSTISGNTTTTAGDTIGGGGIYFFGSATGPVVVQNSTIAENTSAGSGGGIMLRRFGYSTLEVSNSTITGNTAESTTVSSYYTYGGGGINDNDSTAAIVLLNSVVSGNTNANGADLLSGWTAGGYGYVFQYSSLVGDPTGFTLTAGANNLASGTDPMLGTLANNGGPTKTIVPLAGSPLLNAGDNSLVNPSVTTDQRGLSRFDPLDGRVDIGAVEAQPASVTIALDAAQPATTNVADPIVFTVTFSEPVTGFDDTGIDLSGSAIGGTLAVAVTPVSETVYTVTVTGATGDGDVVASVNAGTATVGINASGIPNLPSPAPATVTVDSTAPIVTINQGGTQADPTNVGPVTFTVAFSEPVVGFDSTDISFAGSTVGGTLSAALTPTGPTSYTVTVSGMTGQGTVVASIPAAAVTDPAGNTNGVSASTDNTVLFDAVVPTVTINKAGVQGDPTSQSPIVFNVVFSEPVTGFDVADVSLAGSTAGGPLAAAVTQTGAATYTVNVTGMSSRGTVVASIPAAAAVDVAGNPSTASTSTDNSVEFLNAGAVTLSAATVTTTEGQTLQFTLSRVGGSEGIVTFDFAAAAGTAQVGSDFAASTGTLTWGEGESQDQFVNIAITNDTANEGKETFTFTLSNPTGGLLLGAIPSTTATILQSDGAVINGAAVRPNKPSAVFVDNAGLTGDNVTVTLGGRLGTATVYLTDPDGDGRGPIELIELAGTDPAKSTLTIGVKKPRGGLGDVRTQLAEVIGTGLKALTAPTTDLNGPGINLTGSLRTLKIGHISGGADISIAAPPATLLRPSTRITAGIVGNGTDITVAGAPLAALTVTSFGDGTITAPSVGTINAKGKARTRVAAAIPGDFNGDVVVSGVGVLPTKNALTKLRAAGSMTGTTVTVVGNVGAVVVGGKADGVTIDATGNVRSATFGQFWNSRLDAGYTGPDNGSGTFDNPSILGTFKVTGKTNGFQTSNVIAATINSVTLASVNPVNTAAPGTKFGVTAGTALKGLRVTSPTQKFVFNPRAASPQSTAALGDFQANDLNGPLALSRVSGARALSVVEPAVAVPAATTTEVSAPVAATAAATIAVAPQYYNLGSVTATVPVGNRLSNVIGRGAYRPAAAVAVTAAKADSQELTREERLAMRAAWRAARP